MTGFLIDEMFSPQTAALLRDKYGHDAVHVGEVGLRAADDAQLAAQARAQGRAIVIENVADFAAERDVVLVFVLKRNLPEGGGQAAALADILNLWAQHHPEPYLGPHWPPTNQSGGRSAGGQTHRSGRTSQAVPAVRYRAAPNGLLPGLFTAYGRPLALAGAWAAI